MRILTVLLLIILSFPALAQDRYATLDIFPSHSAVEASEKIDIAIRQTIFDGWHTYWTNPGDSGEPTMIRWDLPNGVDMSPLRFPVPDRIEYDPLVNFGHYGQPIYLQTLSVDKNFKGDEIVLNGHATWLVCDDICIPEEQHLSLTIPVGKDGTEIHQAIFTKANEAFPQNVDWPSTLSVNNGKAVLSVAVPENRHNLMTDVEVFPVDWGIIKTTADVIADINDDTVVFTAEGDTRDVSDIKTSDFLIKTVNQAFMITADVMPFGSVSSNETHTIFMILIFAFIGGLILNLMPCVFPVLSMKALSLVKLSDKEKKHARASGLAYTAGIILSFVAIAAALIILKGAGESIGWGFQLQNPYVVTALATLLFVIGLNLIGIFEISGRFVNVGSKLTQGNDTKSSFFTGVLATLVATPCTAPFMASAIGYALTQNAFVSLFVFAVLGFGLAFPYLLLTFIPSVQKMLPRPGAWMDTFKQALAFPMFASAIWLVWVLAQQAGDLAIIYILGLFLVIVFLIWYFKKSSSKFWRVIIAAFLIGLVIGYSPILSPKSNTNNVAFDPVKLQDILENNPEQAVFTNMTAAWCITCLVNERTSLSDADVVAAFADNTILYMKGDWTNRNAMITQYLESFGRNGVPLYVYYAPAIDGVRPEPEILPQILTPDIILQTIKGD